MAYSDEYFYSMFKKCYEAAMNAKNYGNLAVAKKNFADASAYLLRFAQMSNSANKEEMIAQANRLKNISDMIKVPVQQMPGYGAQNGYGAQGGNAYGAQGGPFSGGSYGSGAYGGDQGNESASDDDMSQYFTFFSAEDLKEGFEGVVGLEEAKDAVTEYVINPIKYPQHYNYSFADNKAVLLEGPPGTGKTTFAKAVAKEINQPFALINVAQLVNCYVGETGKNIDKVFAALRDYTERNNCGLTVFFDELDEIAKKRGGDDKASSSAVPALLRNMDGVKQNKNFLILANTNCMEMLDDGILDRFRKRIHIPLPDKNMRLAFFRSKLSELEGEFIGQLDFEGFAEMSEGLSGRTITYICDDFKYYIGGVKAGIKDGSNLNSVIYAAINQRLNSLHS